MHEILRIHTKIMRMRLYFFFIYKNLLIINIINLALSLHR